MTKRDRRDRRQPGTLALRLRPTLGGYDEVQMLRTGWLMIEQYRLQRLIITVEPTEQSERIPIEA
jgi:hypothetical protein